MPGLARKVIICAAVDGLILQPLAPKKEDQRPYAPVKIKYGDALISQVSRDSVPELTKPNSSFEAFGIVGLITVFRSSYLVSVTRRQQVAQIRGLPIYVVTEVALTPCSSQSEASKAIIQTVATLSRRDPDAIAEDTSDEDDVSPAASGSDEVGDDGHDAAGNPAWSTAASPNNSARSSIAEDVISRRGSYGRFAQRWFSRSGWAMGQKRMMGLSADQGRPQAAGGTPQGSTRQPVVLDDSAANDAAASLLPRLLRTAQILFGSSRSFYFSYDYDITRSMLNPRIPATSLTPLYNHVEPRYFWNEHIIRPFIDAGVDSLALPLMQGFVGQRSFVVDSHPPQVDEGAKDSVELSDFTVKSGSKPGSPPPEKATADLRPTEKKFDITVISRRSIKRAGLRYLRRGVDEDGNVANAVESEQILSPADTTWDPTAKEYSFLQIRGSIPLFFTQSPYSLKPAPVLQHSDEANYAALSKHFASLQKRYGSLQIVNLVEKHGIEASIGSAYEKNVQKLNEAHPEAADQIPFEWFDFHAACRGMKFENVSLILQTLGGKLESFGSSVSVNDSVTARQTGVLRTNCMDCLDRTNVCQSSFAKHMLDQQLKFQGFDMREQLDQENSWFNTLWADNGDAISKQYASTAAMKGDYTRTRKRNYRGALTDASLSLTRLFNGMFNDFFLQTTIDFLLGNVTSLVFEEFEADMMTKDPAVSMQKMREQAIELCHKRVVADESEEFIGGWTLLTPLLPDTIKGQPFEEAVFLLTDAALYLCRFDWNLDKLSSFERVDLAHIQKIRFGTYITSTISPVHIDEMRNVGLVVEYQPGRNDVTRINTRSLSSFSGSLLPNKDPGKNAPSAAPPAGEGSDTKPVAAGLASLFTRPAAPVVPTRKIALKAPYSQTSQADPNIKGNAAADPAGSTTRLREIQQVVVIAAEIERLAAKSQPRLASKAPDEIGLIEKGDIISLAEAKRNTGLLEQLGHSIKKMVWA
ncbi:hypothetical protein GQ53DRAFT_718170 [Thozetella sp. PMI_491]|nr:hypothetical protein GQ53DRAFT_718170 [Thozetella sp. PMI_491]